MKLKDARFFAALFVVIVAAGWFGIARQAEAQEAAARQVAEPDTVAHLQEIIERKDARIVNAREWRENVQSRLYQQRRDNRDLLAALDAALDVEDLPAQDDQWAAGYLSMGGTNLEAFVDVILPCETNPNIWPDPHAQIGDLNVGTSWGRAQIHRPSWEAVFESVFGVEFEDHIREPALNGAMSAIVEQRHATGLGAWSCWNMRGQS